MLSFVLIACGATGSRYFGPLNDWDISCGADQGSITKSADTWIFKTSDNYCSGGTFNQRAEINTENYSTRREGDFLFSSNVAMTAPRNNEYSIFSIHDGRNGCAPPLQLFVRPDGRMYISSDVKTGPGESCVRGSIGGTSPDQVLRDGTEQLLQVLEQMDEKLQSNVVLCHNDLLCGDSLMARAASTSLSGSTTNRRFRVHTAHPRTQQQSCQSDSTLSMASIRRMFSNTNYVQEVCK